MAKFSALPPVPMGSDKQPWESTLLRALSENVELLAGVKGETNNESKAITKGQVGVNELELQKMTNVSNTYNTISGADVASSGVIQDIQTLAEDVHETRQLLNDLIKQLKA